MREKSSLVEVARFVNTLTGLPVTVICENQVQDFYCGEGFRQYMGSHHAKFLETLASESHGGHYDPRYIENELHEGFLEYGLLGDIRILAGPFLLNRSPALQRKTALEILDFDLTHERVSSEYLDQLRTVDTDEIKGIQYLLYLTQRNLDKEEEGHKHTETLVTDYYRNLISNRESYYHHPPFELEKELMEHIRNGRITAAQEMANRLYAHPDARLAATPVRSYRNSLICRCTLYTRAAIDAGAEQEEAFTLSDVMINEIEKKESIQELYRIDLAMIEGFCGLPRQGQGPDLSPMVRRARRFIQDNIYDRLEVGDIAKQLYVHPNYLSGRFRREMGVTLTAYVLQLKVEESLKLLAHSDNTISNIAAFLGFSSQSHFGSVFKKQMGMTPLKYREKE